MSLKNKLQRRLILSLLVGFLGFGGFGYLFFHVQTGEREGETPKLLRHSFYFNEEVWRILSSSKRLSVKKEKPPVGKAPRVNGMLGLESGLYLPYYRVEVNSGDKSLTLNPDSFRVVPKVEYSTDFRCIEGWSEVFHYGGLRFSEFMKFYDLGKKPDGSYYSYVGLETPDGRYYVSLDMESMLHEQTVLAYEMNGKPLSLENGAPIRLIIPIKYGIKSLKRIGRIFFSDTRPPDYWAERGYDWYSGL